MFTIPRGVLEARKIAKDEKTRFAIDGVLFERLPDGTARCVATDGKRIVVLDWDDKFLNDGFPDTGINVEKGATPFSGVVHASVIEKLAKNMPKASSRRSNPTLENALLEESISKPNVDATGRVIGGKVKLATSDGELHTVLETNLLEGVYPPYRDVLPTKQAKFAVVFNPVYLAETVKAMAIAIGRDNPGEFVVMEYLGENDPIRLSVGRGTNNVKATGVLMPINVDKESKIECSPPTVQTKNGGVYTSEDVEKLEREIDALKAKLATTGKVAV